MAQNSEHEHQHPTPGLYLVILTALIIGTCATWGIAFVDLGIWNPVVALAIAVTKAVLVILFFMHVFYSNKLTKLVVLGGLLWLAILLLLTLTDFATRGILGVPGK